MMAVLTLIALAPFCGALAADYGVGPGARHAPHHGQPVPAVCLASSPYTFRAPVAVEMMIGPGIQYQRLAVVRACAELRIIACAYRTGWCNVAYGRYNGWVFDPTRRNISHWVLGH